MIYAGAVTSGAPHSLTHQTSQRAPHEEGSRAKNVEIELDTLDRVRRLNVRQRLASRLTLSDYYV